MPRRGSVPKRDVLPDPMYGSKVVTKLINQVMLDGKKGIAQGIVYDAFTMMSEKTGKEPMEVFKKALAFFPNVWYNIARIRREPAAFQIAVRRRESSLRRAAGV